MNTTPVSARLDPGILAALDRAAAEGYRSRTAQLTKYLIEGLQRDGYALAERTTGEGGGDAPR